MGDSFEESKKKKRMRTLIYKDFDRDSFVNRVSYLIVSFLYSLQNGFSTA